LLQLPILTVDKNNTNFQKLIVHTCTKLIFLVMFYIYAYTLNLGKTYLSKPLFLILILIDIQMLTV